MPIISHQTIADGHLQVDGRRYIRHVFTDHLSNTQPFPLRLVDGAWTEAEYSAERVALVSSVETRLAQQEVKDQIEIAIQGGNPDKVAEHQTQADFDRRFLGEAMLLDAQPFYNCKPVFDRVQTEGANANQRASYLGVTSAEYGLVDDRYNNVNGVAWFLNDEKGMQWVEINEAFI